MSPPEEAISKCRTKRHSVRTYVPDILIGERIERRLVFVVVERRNFVSISNCLEVLLYLLFGYDWELNGRVFLYKHVRECCWRYSLKTLVRIQYDFTQFHDFGLRFKNTLKLLAMKCGELGCGRDEYAVRLGWCDVIFPIFFLFVLFVRCDCPNIFLAIGNLTLVLTLFRFTLFLSFLHVTVLVLSMTFWFSLGSFHYVGVSNGNEYWNREFQIQRSNRFRTRN